VKQIFLAIIIFISGVAFGQQMSYEQWNAEAQTNIRLLPKYGNQPKNEQQKALDDKLIEDYIKRDGSREKGSETLIGLGFKYLYGGDVKTAMYRFNQAWLLNPDNVNVYWGYGAIYMTLGDDEKALAQYNEGLTVNPKSANLLTDKATVYLGRFYRDEKNEDLNKATALLLESYAVDNKNQNTTFKLSICYYLQEDCKNALRYLKECDKAGGQPVTNEYRKDLENNCGK